MDNKKFSGGGRNSSIDLYRCVLMMGIVAQHVVSQSAYVRHGVDFLTNWCVCGFVFVSGYFGIKFRPSKVISLIALGIFCSVVSNMAHGCSFLLALNAVRWYWYLWAYVFLMLMAPSINTAFEKADKRTIITFILPIAVLCWGWNFLSGLPVVRDFAPVCKYIGSMNGPSLVCLYVFVLAYRKLEFSRYCTMRNGLKAVPICLVLMLLGFWSYAWIPAFVMTCFSFEFFKRLNLPAWIGKLCTFVAPSMFSVYLLHICNCRHLMWRFEEYCVQSLNMPIGMMFILTSIVTFSSCLMIDLMRRGALCPFRNVILSVYSRLDCAYEFVITKLERV